MRIFVSSTQQAFEPKDAERNGWSKVRENMTVLWKWKQNLSWRAKGMRMALHNKIQQKMSGTGIACCLSSLHKWPAKRWFISCIRCVLFIVPGRENIKMEHSGFNGPNQETIKRIMIQNLEETPKIKEAIKRSSWRKGKKRCRS